MHKQIADWIKESKMKTVNYKYKSKAAAIILALLFGSLGLHRFYLGNHLAGVAFILFTVICLSVPVLGNLIFAVVLADIVVIVCQDKEYFKRTTGYSEVVA